jgi:[ribosomal protein S5]-alanine N-acetyltransferase
MDRRATLPTDRLLLEAISENDGDFMVELMNTDGWIKFIGDRNIHTTIDAVAYIQKINVNQNIVYWVVKLKDAQTKIGIVTLIKRDHLEHKDIGFAFLPGFSNRGYAFEAANAVLTYLARHRAFMEILAVTLPENINSIKLLQKLGLRFKREMEGENQTLHIYSIRLSGQTPGTPQVQNL